MINNHTIVNNNTNTNNYKILKDPFFNKMLITVINTFAFYFIFILIVVIVKYITKWYNAY